MRLLKQMEHMYYSHRLGKTKRKHLFQFSLQCLKSTTNTTLKAWIAWKLTPEVHCLLCSSPQTHDRDCPILEVGFLLLRSGHFWPWDELWPSHCHPTLVMTKMKTSQLFLGHLLESTITSPRVILLQSSLPEVLQLLITSSSECSEVHWQKWFQHAKHCSNIN